MISDSSYRNRLDIRIDDRKGLFFCSTMRNQYAGDSNENPMTNHQQAILDAYFGTTFIELYKEFVTIGHVILETLLDGLNYTWKDEILQTITEDTSANIMRMIEYSNLPNNEDLKELAVDHTDLGLLTLMSYSEAESLQILSPTFEWTPIEQKFKSKSKLLAIAGEQLSFLSNYQFQAMRHRVINQSIGPRFSFPFLMRSPPEYQIKQMANLQGPLIVKKSKLISNHIFHLSESLQNQFPYALSMIKNLELIFKKSSKKIVLLSSVLIENIKKDFEPQDHNCFNLLLIFEDLIPTESTHKKIFKLWPGSSSQSLIFPDSIEIYFKPPSNYKLFFISQNVIKKNYSLPNQQKPFDIILNILTSSIILSGQSLIEKYFFE